MSQEYRHVGALTTESTSLTNFYLHDLDELNDFTKVTPISDKLFVMHLNVQRICNLAKFDELLIYIDRMSTKPDVMVLTETWITRGTEPLYQILNYDAHHCCRDTSSAGITVFVRHELSMNILEESNDAVSFVHLELSQTFKPDTKLLVTAFYMPDQSNFILLDDRILSNASGDHLLLGDFNINIHRQNSTARTYLDTIESFGYSIKNTFQTRPVSGTCIDHIIANFTNTVCVTLENQLSDHNGILTIFENPFLRHTIRGYETKSRYRIDYVKVAADLDAICDDPEYESFDAKTFFKNFHDELGGSIQRHTSLSLYKVKKNNDFAAS